MSKVNRAAGSRTSEKVRGEKKIDGVATGSWANGSATSGGDGGDEKKGKMKWKGWNSVDRMQTTRSGEFM